MFLAVAPFTIIANRYWPVEQSDVMQTSFFSSRDVSNSYRKSNNTTNVRAINDFIEAHSCTVDSNWNSIDPVSA